MPMPALARAANYVACPNLRSGTALALRPTYARQHEQCLSQRMRVPVRPRGRLEGHNSAACRARFLDLEEAVDANGAGEVLGGSFDGWLGAVPDNLHADPQVLILQRCGTARQGKAVRPVPSSGRWKRAVPDPKRSLVIERRPLRMAPFGRPSVDADCAASTLTEAQAPQTNTRPSRHHPSRSRCRL